MKLIIMSLIMVTGLLLSCGPTKYETTTSGAAYAEVPTGVKENFTAQYPTATNVVWSKYELTAVPIDWQLTDWPVLEADDYTVTFDMEGEKYYAWYDSNGSWIGSAYEVRDITTLPAAIHTMIQNKYSGYSIVSAEKEMWKDHMAYEVKLKSGENKIKILTDSNGNVLKEKVKD